MSDTPNGPRSAPAGPTGPPYFAELVALAETLGITVPLAAPGPSARIDAALVDHAAAGGQVPVKFGVDAGSDAMIYANVAKGARKLRTLADVIERAAGRRARIEGMTVRELADRAGLTERAAATRYALAAVRYSITRDGSSAPDIDLDLAARGSLDELDRWLETAEPGPATVTAHLPDGRTFPLPVSDLADPAARDQIRAGAAIWRTADPDLDTHIRDRAAEERLHSYYVRQLDIHPTGDAQLWATTLPPETFNEIFPERRDDGEDLDDDGR